MAINDWIKNTPNTVRTTKVQGDKNYASQFIGEVDLLVYQTRNRMSLGNLNQLRSQRIFSDGTQITVTSIFGHDIVNVNVSKSTQLFPQLRCVITLIGIPEKVQPMRYPGEIHAGEVENVDYIKTYYTFDVSGCITCSDATFALTFQFNTTEPIDYYDSEPSNHCVYSTDGGCSGEVISQGSDDGGNYVIWKAYTESSSHTRSGYGYVFITASISDTFTGQEICSSNYTVEVDCCEKSGLLQPEIYWQCGIWTLCESPEIDGLGEVPSVISYLTLSDCIAGVGTCTFYALPEVGGCLPYDWTLAGPGSLDESPLGTQAVYHGDEDYEGCEDYTITVKDRCGGEDIVTVSCCQFTISVTITYTTLQMSCDQTQTVYVEGGCPPYTWSLSGGGTLEPVPSGLSALYTAPSSNAGCSNNPTITVSDCCGYNDDIRIAVNCYTPNYLSFVKYDWTVAGACPGGQPLSVMKYYNLNRGSYDCDGDLFFYNPGVSGLCVCSSDVPDHGGAICSTGGGAVTECEDTGPYGKCYYTDGLGNWGCDGLHVFAANQQTYDCRTPAIIAAGCCPLNPYTGQPW